MYGLCVDSGAGGGALDSAGWALQPTPGNAGGGWGTPLANGFLAAGDPGPSGAAAEKWVLIRETESPNA